jgi:cGMP-dependent protein kinase
MGAGASADQARNTVSMMLMNKPEDASDITDLGAAKNEIVSLRKMAKSLMDALTKDDKVNIDKGPKKREAVRDQGKVVNFNADFVPRKVDKSDSIRDLLMGIVSTNVLFSSYAKEDQIAIVDAFEDETVTSETFVIRQGESGEKFYIVESGSLDIYVKGAGSDPQKVGSPLSNGKSFGELALMYNTPRAASIKASTECKLWSIDRNTYRNIIQFYKHQRNKQYMEFLRKVQIQDKPLGDLMSERELETMTISLDRENFEAGETIIRQGNTGDHFYIIATGNVGVYKANAETGKEDQLAVLTEGKYFGEKALLSEDKRAASCIAETAVTCLTLGREDFIDMMGTVDDMIAKGKNVEEKAPEEVVDADKFALDIKLEDLEIRTTLGCGAFGRVKLCKHGDKYYALKCQSKSAIVESGLEEHVLNEMRVMRKVDHPLIAKLHVALQDNKFIYFVLELLQGGELFTHLRSKGKLPEQAARFYAASVVYAFATLHAKRIAYRDLKPENLVMDTNGYTKLVDFGLAKQLLSGKTWTLCGTPDYLAPEIILNEGHDLAVDYWALGVLIFEMVVGAPPFYAEDPMEVYEKILGGNPAMPTFFTRNLSDLIKKLLRSQQGKRLGNSRGGTAAVIKHKWFSSFDWTGLESGEMKAPYKPTIASPDDVTNFDTFDEGEMPAVSTWMPDLNA